jgi:2,4-dienoyl-CoA reductase-like NADH-dependent reductase (Old Yellow Enzyme family)
MTNILFTPGKIGTLSLPNRLVRSATAERMADDDGRLKEPLFKLYEELTVGGVGLIITGHMYVHPSGKVHPEMTGIYSDDLLLDLERLARVIHERGGKVVAQINHGGMQCDPKAVTQTMAPSAIEADFLEQPTREMTEEEIFSIIGAYSEATRRVKEAGFDGIQIHAAHGYLISQFLSPFANRRDDDWGGDRDRRMKFLREVARAVRNTVGNDFPMLIKLGMMDGVEGGLTPEAGVSVVRELDKMGFDAIEISGGISGRKNLNTRKGIRSEADEAFFLPLAQKARPATALPILLVGGFRSMAVMERVLQEGAADFISLARPLISEPDFPRLMQQGLRERSRCISANNCWPTKEGEGIACKCPLPEIEGQ